MQDHDSRRVGVRPATALPASSSEGMFGGGGGGGEPRMLSRMYRPRFTGEVRSGFDVTARTVPCVRTPPRGLSAGRSTRRISSPCDALDPVVLRQPLVEERVVAVEQLQEAPVLPDDVLEEHLRLAPHGLPEVAGQLEFAEAAERRPNVSRALLQLLLLAGGELLGRLADELPEPRPPPFRLGVGRLVAGDHGGRVDEHRLDVARLEPLADEVADELRRARVGEHPLDLGLEVRAELVLAGQAEQLVVGHGRPEEVREPRGQGVLVDRRIPARGRRLGRLLAEEEPGRGQHGRHRLGDAPLEGLPLLGRDGLGERRQPVLRRVVHGAAEGPLGEPAQELAGVAPAPVGVRGDLAGEEAFVIRRPDPVPLVHRPAQGRRLDAERQRPDLLLARRQRLDLDRQRVRPGLPVAIELEAERLPVLPDEFPPDELLAVGPEDEPASVVVD